MKKIYNQPEIIVTEFHASATLLANSLGIHENGSTARGSSALSNGKEQPGNSPWDSSLWGDNSAAE